MDVQPTEGKHDSGVLCLCEVYLFCLVKGRMGDERCADD